MTDDITGRVAVITGASSGIGLVAAKALLRQGFHIIAQGRDPGRTASAEAELKLLADQVGGRVDMLRADLSLLSDTARLADEIGNLTDRVDVLLANAGGVCSKLALTSEGFEETVAGNYLGHFLLTTKLLPQLRTAARTAGAGNVRIVNTSSLAHLGAPPIDWNDLAPTSDWASGRAYSLAKLYNVLSARELARRLAPDGIVANSVHPGVIDSNFVNHCDPQMKANILSRELSTPEQGADTLIWLASAPEAGSLTGLYFHKREAIEMSAQAQDDDAARRLWDESEKLVAARTGNDASAI